MSLVSKANFCIDCTPEYKRQMIRRGRCEYPKTAFKKKRGEIVGVCSVEMLRQKVIDYQNKLWAGLPLQPPLR